MSCVKNCLPQLDLNMVGIPGIHIGCNCSIGYSEHPQGMLIHISYGPLRVFTFLQDWNGYALKNLFIIKNQSISITKQSLVLH